MTALNAPRERVTPAEPVSETTQRFARQSRNACTFIETDPPYWTRAELAVYIACTVATLILVGIFAFEYITTGRL